MVEAEEVRAVGWSSRQHRLVSDIVARVDRHCSVDLGATCPIQNK